MPIPCGATDLVIYPQTRLVAVPAIKLLAVISLMIVADFNTPTLLLSEQSPSKCIAHNKRDHMTSVIVTTNKDSVGAGCNVMLTKALS